MDDFKKHGLDGFNGDGFDIKRGKFEDGLNQSISNYGYYDNGFGMPYFEGIQPIYGSVPVHYAPLSIQEEACEASIYNTPNFSYPQFYGNPQSYSHGAFPGPPNSFMFPFVPQFYYGQHQVPSQPQPHQPHQPHQPISHDKVERFPSFSPEEDVTLVNLVERYTHADGIQWKAIASLMPRPFSEVDLITRWKALSEKSAAKPLKLATPAVVVRKDPFDPFQQHAARPQEKFIVINEDDSLSNYNQGILNDDTEAVQDKANTFNALKGQGWTEAEDKRLMQLVVKYQGDGKKSSPTGEETLDIINPADLDAMCDWNMVSQKLGSGKSSTQCRTRWSLTLLPKLQGTKSGSWTSDEDAVLIQEVLEFQRKHYPHQKLNVEYGDSPMGMTWGEVARKLGNRTAIQCRNRWKQALQPKMMGMKTGGWSEAEDKALLAAVKAFSGHGRAGGVDWNSVSKQVLGRTPKHCINRWNNHLKAKAATMGIVTSNTTSNNKVVSGVAFAASINPTKSTSQQATKPSSGPREEPSNDESLLFTLAEVATSGLATDQQPN